MEASSILMPQSEQAHPCVMVVEDDQRIGEALTHLLHAEGYRVDRCCDGREAIAHLRAGTHPDVILLDLMMPHVNGWEFRVQQKDEPEWAEIPVIVMSADDSPQASAIDADAYLKKPVDDTVLLDSLGRLLHGRDQARRDARAAELDRMNALGVLAAGLTHEITSKRASVLVVDDETMMCDLLRNMLEEKYDVTTISNPREALPKLLQGESFDLVLCDLMMPELTGMDLYTELSKTRPEQAARFVFMTGGTFTDRARDFLDQIEGAPLNKPFRAEELYAMVSQRLQRFSERESPQPHAYN